MSTLAYQSPWRNSLVMAPNSRRFSQGITDIPKNLFPIPFPRSLEISAEALPPDRDILEGLAEDPVQTVEVPVQDEQQEDVSITDCTYIGSYNWVREDTTGGLPTILVPGSPPHWQNRQVPYTIPPDRGIHYNDLDGYKLPKAPLLPLILAVNKRAEMTNTPAFDWSNVDIVTDRNNLLKLMRCVSGSEAAGDFRIDLQLAGTKTLLMSRWSKRYRELHTGRTYGSSFVKESTLDAPECKSTLGHYRIVTYDFSGLKMVVRFPVDACIRPPTKYPRRSMSSIDELSRSLSLTNNTSISVSHIQTTFRSEYPVVIREGGSSPSPAALIALDTRSQAILSSRGFDWSDAYPKLFFAQMANHYLAVHKHGRFAHIEKRKMSSELQKVVAEENLEAEVKCALKKVRKLLEVIKLIVLEKGKEGRLSLVCGKDGLMSVYERSSEETLLPAVVMKQFEAS